MPLIPATRANKWSSYAWVIPRVLVLFAGAPIGSLIWTDWQSTTDYGSLPVDQVYREVTGTDPKPGITNHNASGHRYALGIKHWVWITGDASEAGIKRIAGGQEPLDSASSTNLGIPDYAESKRFWHQDQERVGWGELAAVGERDVYYVQGASATALLFGPALRCMIAGDTAFTCRPPVNKTFLPSAYLDGGDVMGRQAALFLRRQMTVLRG